LLFATYRVVRFVALASSPAKVASASRPAI
jgi:hypothetical protein